MDGLILFSGILLLHLSYEGICFVPAVINDIRNLTGVVVATAVDPISLIFDRLSVSSIFDLETVN